MKNADRRKLYFGFLFFIFLPVKRNHLDVTVNDDNTFSRSDINSLQVYTVSEVSEQMMSYYTWFMWMCVRIRRYMQNKNRNMREGFTEKIE